MCDFYIKTATMPFSLYITWSYRTLLMYAVCREKSVTVLCENDSR